MTEFREQIPHFSAGAMSHRLRGALLLIGKNLPPPLYKWVARRRVRQHERFDSRYGLDTQAPVPVLELETAVLGGRSANRYEGTPIAPLHKLIRRLSVERSRFTFIDLGSGKGRVLLIAGQYPFKSVIGVEFSKRLHEIALKNIRRFSQSNLTRTTIASVNCDASNFDFSEIGDKIVFCYNPFGANLMNRVLDKLEPTASQPGETVLLYLGPIPQEIAERLTRFPVLGRGEFLSEFGFFEQYSIYKLSEQVEHPSLTC
jgi:SAM-dependent methyltransferase